MNEREKTIGDDGEKPEKKTDTCAGGESKVVVAMFKLRLSLLIQIPD